MKITVVSRNERRLAEIARLLRERSDADEIDVVAGSLERLGNLNAQNAPELLVLDHPSGQADDLARLERLGGAFPRMEFIVLSEVHTLAFLMEAMRAGVREVLPWQVSADALFPAVARIDEKLLQHTHANGKVLAFVSCKGGSGATFLATNLGYALAELAGKRVALVDLNLQFGDASLFLADQKPVATLADVALQIHRLDASLLASSMMNVTPNFSVLAAPDNPGHAGDILPEHIDALLRLARRHYDFVILDVGRSLDPVSLRALDQADTVFPVLQTTLPYIRDGKRLIEVFRSLGYPKEKIQVIVNRHEKKSDIKLHDLERACATTVTMSVPNHYETAAASVNQGVPVMKLAKNSPIARALKTMALQIAPPVQVAQHGWVARIFKGAQAAAIGAPVFEEKQPWMQKS
ncbi:AAA family ATPase [Massilia cavernae]|uniref:Response regulator receiver protein n=1 Tax=Massilia cavernae TaxID=2320864 RepID=A0A418XXW1_9BURK|nr:AAA family ATPase [Massilia cavernae]RJG17807.1 response regulator receiver protein [Massilia cavernae]